jgi:outer membrane protein OmpA-like peptidoglycan-associated protein
VLEPLAALLANNPDWQITIESHTDNRGAQNVLQQLTQERAERLGEQLVAAGVDAARVQATGLGATRPLSSSRTVAARARNRRTEITLAPAPLPAANASASEGTGSSRN